MISFRIRRRFLALFLALLWGGWPLAAAAQSTVLVFAAASLKPALSQVVEAYQSISPDRVNLSFAGSSALTRQIQYGAPADIFISANAAWMDVLEQEGALAPQSRTDLLSNTLVLIGPADAPQLGPIDLTTAQAGDEILARLGEGWLAMALVDAVPAGLYGRDALRSLGVWDEVKEQVAQGDNVRAALRMVAIGEARLGVVYATDATSEADVEIVARFAPQSHPQILYPAALITNQPTRAARDFFAYLTGPSAQAIFDAYGFGRPDRQTEPDKS